MSERLRSFLQSDGTRAEKALALLGVFGNPASIADLKKFSAENGLKIGNSWNLSSSLQRSGGLAIRTTQGWELTNEGKNAVAALGLGLRTAAVVDTLTNLRAEVNRLSSSDTVRFLIEAIECVEQGYHRAATIMSWVAAAHVLQSYVVVNRLDDFNDEARRRDAKWKTAKNVDDVGRLKESDFLDIIEKLSIIGKNVKTELKGCLDRRNACGHPNSYELKELTVAHHVEILVLNVFAKF